MTTWVLLTVRGAGLRSVLLPFEFTMAGDWYAQLEVRRGDGSTVTRILELPGVRAD